MTAYVLRRLVHMVPVLFLITLFVFFVVRLVPGDPATIMLGQRATPERIAALKKTLKLDSPIWTQYAAFMQNLAQGDLGESVRRREPVRDIVLDRLQPTLFLVRLRDASVGGHHGAAGDVGGVTEGAAGRSVVRVFVDHLRSGCRGIGSG